VRTGDAGPVRALLGGENAPAAFRVVYERLLDEMRGTMGAIVTS
jgi:hypothetical protein